MCDEARRAHNDREAVRAGRPAPGDPDWRRAAACRGTPVGVFFPPPGASEAARRVCGGCGAAADCLRAAVEECDRHGVRGGFTPAERAELELEVVS